MKKLLDQSCDYSNEDVAEIKIASKPSIMDLLPVENKISVLSFCSNKDELSVISLVCHSKIFFPFI